MGVQNGSCVNLMDQHQMQRCFCAGLTLSRNDLSLAIHFNQLIAVNPSFVDAAGRHQNAQWICIQNHTEISSRSIAPSPLRKDVDRVNELLLEAVCLGQ